MSNVTLQEQAATQAAMARQALLLERQAERQQQQVRTIHSD
jgi:hypothetical protein